MPSVGGSASDRKVVAWCVALAVGCIALAYGLQGRLDFNAQDEGFLWYGVQRTAAGAMPLLDFRAYDPGRYLWCAAWSFVFGKGLLAVRLASHLFAGVGLVCGLLAASRVVKQPWLLAAVGLLLTTWLFPPWKFFEPAIAMTAVWIAVRLVERPTLARHFAAGAFAGFAAFVGRNHGLYAVVAQFALIAFVALRTEPRALVRRLVAWIVGIALGYSPMLVMVATVPGYWQSLLDSIRFYAEQESTNLAIDAPWPWTQKYADLELWDRATTFGVGAGFVLFFLYVPAMFVALRAKALDFERRSLLIGATFVGAVYTHHAAVRSDVSHLAQAIHPLLLLLLCAPGLFARGRTTWSTALTLVLLLAFSAISIGPSTPLGRRLKERAVGADYVLHDLAGDPLLLRPTMSRYLTLVQAQIRAHVAPNESIFIAPNRPGLYALLGKVAPTWDTYMAWPANDEQQARTIRELEHVDWALIFDMPVGGSNDMRFKNSNPLVWRYLLEHFTDAPGVALPPQHVFLHRKSAQPLGPASTDER
ncbi:MAG: hypothetical protein K8S98_14465 [Planctomycetes bacterium]|nr:hypothetical protein [Planctomycetota bacterium]